MIENTQISIDKLYANSLQRVFEFVGVNDVMTTVRLVCKSWKDLAESETLASFFVKENDWTDDFNLCKQLGEHKTKYEHCFKRATVRKFYHKFAAFLEQILPAADTAYDEEPPTPETVRQWWQEMTTLFTAPTHKENEEQELVFILPWLYMEFMLIFKGIEVDVHQFFLQECGRVVYDGSCETEITDLHKTRDIKSSLAWVCVFMQQDGNDSFAMCCDKDHPDYGTITYFNDDYEVELRADSFLEILRGFNFVLKNALEKLEIDASQLREILDTGYLHELLEPHSWLTENGKAATTTTVTKKDVEEYRKRQEEKQAKKKAKFC